jgi:hypothetical protein
MGTGPTGTLRYAPAVVRATVKEISTIFLVLDIGIGFLLNRDDNSVFGLI